MGTGRPRGKSIILVTATEEAAAVAQAAVEAVDRVVVEPTMIGGAVVAVSMAVGRAILEDELMSE